MKALELKSTFALGGMCLVLVLMLMGSGALMLFSYQPFPKFAYTSVQFLDNQFVFGRLKKDKAAEKALLRALALEPGKTIRIN